MEDFLLTQTALVDAGVLCWCLQLDDSGVKPLGAIAVHQLAVDHSSLTSYGAVEVYHGHALVVGSDHSSLHHLSRYQLLQCERRQVLVVHGGDIC